MASCVHVVETSPTLSELCASGLRPALDFLQPIAQYFLSLSLVYSNRAPDELHCLVHIYHPETVDEYLRSHPWTGTEFKITPHGLNPQHGKPMRNLCEPKYERPVVTRGTEIAQAVRQAYEKLRQIPVEEHSHLVAMRLDYLLPDLTWLKEPGLIAHVRFKDYTPCGETKLPDEIDGVPVHFSQSICDQLMGDGFRREVLSPGLAIGAALVADRANARHGTIGLFVQRRSDRTKHLLTCAHVTDLGCGTCGDHPGVVLTQPHPFDWGRTMASATAQKKDPSWLTRLLGGSVTPDPPVVSIDVAKPHSRCYASSGSDS